MTTTLGAGIGGSVGVAAQGTWNASFVTSTRWPSFKSCAMTWDPIPTQGGTYLRSGGIADIGTARVILLPTVSTTQGPMATGTLSGDFVNVGMAGLLTWALGSNATLTQSGTTTAYQLGGASGATLSKPDLNSTWFDMQLGAPTTDGTVQAESYHSCVITKATWVFDRTGLVTYSYDIFSSFVELTTSFQAVTEPSSPVPFAMQNSTCLFKVGAFGSEAAVDGIRKATITLERKLKLGKDRLYLGNITPDSPVTNDNVVLSVDLDTDYSTGAKTNLFDKFQAGTGVSIVCTSVGNAIGSSGLNDTFTLNPSSCYVDSGGDRPLKGPDIINNTIHLTGKLDSAGDAQLTAKLNTADTIF